MAPTGITSGRRFRRGLLAAGEGFVLCLVLIAALCVGAFLHLNLPAGRAAAAELASKLASNALVGSIRVGSVERILPGAVRMRDVHAFDASGAEVVRVSELRVRFDAVRLLTELLMRDQVLDIVLDHVRVDGANVAVEENPVSQLPRIAEAFMPAPSPSTRRAAARSALRVFLRSIEIGAAKVKLRLSGVPPIDGRVTRLHASLAADANGAGIDVGRFAVQAREASGLSATGTGSFQLNTAGRLLTSFEGYVGAVQVTARLGLKGRHVALSAEVPRASPQDVRDLWPDYPLVVPAGYSLGLVGDAPHLRAKLAINLDGGGVIAASGPVDAERGKVELAVHTDALTLRTFHHEAPDMRVTSAGGLTLQRHGQDWRADLSLHTNPSLLWGEAVPSVETVAHFESQTLTGTAVLNEPGAPVRAAYRLALGKPLHLELDLPWFRLERAPRAKKYVQGATGSVRGAVAIDVGADSITSTATLQLSHLRRDVAEVAGGTIRVDLRGDPRAPRTWVIATTTHLSGARYGNVRFASVDLSTSGTLLQPYVVAALDDSRRARVRVSGQLDIDDRLELARLRFALEREGRSLEGRLDRAVVLRDSLELEGLAVEQGSGSLRGRATLAKDLIELDLQARSWDLQRTAELAGLDSGFLAGVIDCDATLTEHASTPRLATMHLRTQALRFGELPALTATFDAALDGSALKGTVTSEVEGLGIVSGHLDASLPGSVTDSAAWRSLTGDALFELNYLRLSALQPLLSRYVSVSRIDGIGYAQVRLVRGGSGALPQAMFVGVTEGLALDWAAPSRHEGTQSGTTTWVGTGPVLDFGGTPDGATSTPSERRAPVSVESEVRQNGASTLEIRGVDLEAALTLDQATGNLQGSLQLLHGRTPWVNATGSLALALSSDDLLAGTALAQLENAAFQLRAVVLERPVTELPEWVPISLPAETVSAELVVSGTVKAPVAMGKVNLIGLAMPGSPLTTPVDVDLRATYDFIQSSVVAYGTATTKGRQVALLQAQSVPQALDDSAKVDARRTYALLTLDGLPLTVIAPLADSNVDGKLHGTVSVEQTSESPRVTANVRVESLTVDRVPLGDARLVARSEGSIVNARARFTKESGTFEARLIAPIDWSELIPQLAEDRTIALGIDAEDYDAAILEPFVRDLFGEIGGSVDADLDIDVESRTLRSESDYAATARGPEEVSDARQHEWFTTARGTVGLREGVIQERSMGLELRHVAFDLTAEPQRELTSVEIRDVSACARSEIPNLKGEGVLYLDGLDFVRGSGSVNLDRFPVVLEGVTRAEATGTANVQVEKRPDQISVNVSVPELTAVLPRNSGRSVLSLDEERSIQVLQPLEEPSKPRAPDALPWHIRVELGDRVRARREEFNIPVRGTPELWLSDKLTARGEVELVPGGHMVLLGKVFVIESGLVGFDKGDPSDPTINVTAVWRGPSHVVTVRVLGPMSNAAVTLTSDPPLPETEVFALILGGGPEEGGSAAATGFGVGSQLWNGLFANTALSAVNIRASSEEQRAMYTAAVPVSEEVWFEASYKTGVDGTQASPGASGTEPGVSGTVDWRFRKDWSLRTDVGTLGAGFDLLWQYRY